MKILFIACYSPLINNSAAIETLQYLNKLDNIKENEIHLLTVNFPKDSIYYDSKLFSMMNSSIKLHAVDGGKLFNKIMPKKKTVNSDTKLEGSSKKTSLARMIKNSLAIPDMYLYWAFKASKYGKKLVSKEKFDVIFSMHEPPSSHICAYLIKRKFKALKWITYWSDPWIKDSTREKNIVIRKLIEKKLENLVVTNSDKLIFVTDENRNDYVNTYNIPIDSTFILNRGYDKQIYDKIRDKEKPNLIKEDKVNIIYAGEIFSKLRDVNPFIEAIKKIKLEDKYLYNKLNILFFGNIDNDEIRYKLSNEEAVTISSRIAFDEALNYMINGDILLLFGNKQSKQIPGKIYDYFGTDSWILNIYGDKNDPIKKLVQNHYKCYCCDNNSEDIKFSILELIDKVEKEIYPKADENYEWDKVALRLNDILRG